MFGWKSAAKAAAASRGASFLSRLRRDTRGNTLAIVGAALVPLAAMIGSGVDMSRAYMAKARLQNACDAAALAGRRIMQADTPIATVEAEAERFFYFNFPQTGEGANATGPYGTAAVDPTVTSPTTGTVQVEAQTEIPTTIMQMFGFTTLPLNVTCNASLDFVNTDVVLVLDVTGSMLCTPEEAGTCGRTSEISTSRIVALRDAVMALYEELEPIQQQLEANHMRLRLGVVPFSSTVNVGRLISGLRPKPEGGGLDGSPNYLVGDGGYQSRTANYHTPTYVGTVGTPEAPVQQIYGSSLTQDQCDKYGRNVSFSGFSPSATSGGGPAPTPTWARSFSNNEASGVDWGWSGASDRSTGRNDDRMSCRRRYVETDTTYTTRYRFTNWVYEVESYDVREFGDDEDELSIRFATNTGGSIAAHGNYDPREVAELATNEGTGVTPLTTTNVSWNGCIEERATDSGITPTTDYTSIPADAHDLDINLVPDSNETRWRPHFPNAIFYWETSGTDRWESMMTNSFQSGYYACPSEAARLKAWTQDDLQEYVNDLIAVGGTYHDIGMIWGARLISPNGIFSDSPAEFNDMPVARHIIYMTDGQLSTNQDSYTAYGVEQHSHRVTGNATNAANTTERNGRHTTRFRMICDAAKATASIWVVAFATTPDAAMQECATNQNQFFSVSNRAQLIERFRQIGSQIGALRLTQ